MTGARPATAAAGPDPAGGSARLLTGLAFGLVGSALFSAKGVLVKYLFLYGADPATLLAWRMACALPFFVLVAWWVDRPRPAAAAAASPWRPRDRWWVAGLGFSGYYVSALINFYGLQYVTVTLERLVMYLTPTAVMLITVLVMRRRATLREWASLAIAYGGVVLVLSQDLAIGGSNVPLGVALVAVAMLGYAVYLVAGGEMVKRLGSLRMTAWTSIVASFFCIAHALAMSGRAAFELPAIVYWLSLLNGLVCTVVPIFLVMACVERLGPAVAAQTGMIGPAATIALGAVVLGEPVTAIQLVGTAVVLLGIFVLTTGRQH